MPSIPLDSASPRPSHFHPNKAASKAAVEAAIAAGLPDSLLGVGFFGVHPQKSIKLSLKRNFESFETSWNLNMIEHFFHVFFSDSKTVIDPSICNNNKCSNPRDDANPSKWWGVSADRAAEEAGKASGG